jgi:HSP20 family protein
MYCGPRGMHRRGWQWDSQTDTAYQPLPVDVFEKDDAFVIRLSVPGMKTEEINVSVEGDTVTIRGERPEPEIEGTMLLHERYAGRLGRTLTLPVDLETDKTEASLEDGVLTVRVKKSESVKSKAIPIQKKN